MTFARPEYTRGEVQRAGALLARTPDEEQAPVERTQALAVVNNWRAAHAYPLNTFQATLRDKLRRLGVDAVVGERLKRLPSILSKLQRQPNMNLQQMQDIAGLRAVVHDARAIATIRENYESSRFQHELRGVDDYIADPKIDGYRSLHLNIDTGRRTHLPTTASTSSCRSGRSSSTSGPLRSKRWIHSCNRRSRLAGRRQAGGVLCTRQCIFRA